MSCCSKTTGVLAANEVDQVRQSSEEDVAKRFAPGPMGNVINEEPEEEDEFVSEKPPLPPSAHASPNVNGCTARFQQPQAGPSYVWRIDLSKTEVFWTGWFKGLSQKFLDLPLPKVLLLANIQGLDTALTIGQMQGRLSPIFLLFFVVHQKSPSWLQASFRCRCLLAQGMLYMKTIQAKWPTYSVVTL